MFRSIYLGKDPVEYDRICHVLGKNEIKFWPKIETIEKGFSGNEQILEIKVRSKDFENAGYLINKSMT